jgi:hypothetical protein
LSRLGFCRDFLSRRDEIAWVISPTFLNILMDYIKLSGGQMDDMGDVATQKGCGALQRGLQTIAGLAFENMHRIIFR